MKEKEGADDTITVELPKKLKVGYTEPSGTKHEKELDVTQLDGKQVADLLNKGAFAEVAKGDLNAQIKKAREDAITETLTKAKSLNAEDVQKQIETYVSNLATEEVPELDEEAIKNGDYSSFVKVDKYNKKMISDLRNIISERDEQAKLNREFHNTYNKNIGQTLNDFPKLEEKWFVPLITKLEINPQAIHDFGELLNTLKSHGVDPEKLTSEQKKGLYEDLKKEYETPPPPPEGGGEPPEEEKEEEEKAPTTYGEIRSAAEKLMQKYKKEGRY